MDSHDLRFTDTNSGDDSHGRTWGLEGKLFWFLTGGAFLSVVLMLLLFIAFKLGFTMSIVIAGMPLVVAVAYVFGFRQGKPPRYDLDCIEFCFDGRGFGPDPATQLKHPLHTDDE